MSAPASASAPARSPLATQGLGMAYAIGAIISMQFGSALAKTMMGDLGAWGVVTLRLITSSLLRARPLTNLRAEKHVQQ